MKKTSMKKGFTLVELLITIVLLGIIGGIVIYNMTNISRDTKENDYERFIAEIKSGFNSETNGAYDKIEQLKEIEVLMLDDIGSESMTSWMRDEVLGRILNYRMHQGLPTFFSSNLDYQQLQHHYSYTQKGEVEEIKGARVLERIKALTVPVKIAGTNYRQKR